MSESQTWSSGICGCCSDCKSCLLVYLAPCIVVPLQKRKLDGLEGFGECFFNFCVLNSYNWRSYVRNSYGIGGNCFVEDILLPWFCGPFSTCQAYREVDIRGTQSQIKTADGDKPLEQQLFSGCFEDFKGCLLSYLCGGLPISLATASVLKSSCLFNYLCVPYAWQRQIVRRAHGVEGSCFNDLVWSWLRGYLPCIFFLDEARIVRLNGGFNFDSSLICNNK